MVRRRASGGKYSRDEDSNSGSTLLSPYDRRMRIGKLSPNYHCRDIRGRLGAVGQRLMEWGGTFCGDRGSSATRPRGSAQVERGHGWANTRVCEIAHFTRIHLAVEAKVDLVIGADDLDQRRRIGTSSEADQSGGHRSRDRPLSRQEERRPRGDANAFSATRHSDNASASNILSGYTDRTSRDTLPKNSDIVTVHALTRRLPGWCISEARSLRRMSLAKLQRWRGARALFSLSHVTNFLEGRLTPFASTRNVRVTSPRGNSAEYDLLLAQREGRIDQDSHLYPGRPSPFRSRRSGRGRSGEVAHNGSYERRRTDGARRVLRWRLEGSRRPRENRTTLQSYLSWRRKGSRFGAISGNGDSSNPIVSRFLACPCLFEPDIGKSRIQVVTT